MRPSQTKAKLKRGEPTLVTSRYFIDSSLHEFVSLMGCDLIMVKQGMEQIQQKYAPLGFTFENRLAEGVRLAKSF